MMGVGVGCCEDVGRALGGRWRGWGWESDI